MDKELLGTSKMVLFWDFITVVVGMWQTKTWRHPSGLNSDSGVFDLCLESQSIRETRSLTDHRVQSDYIIDEETSFWKGSTSSLRAWVWDSGKVRPRVNLLLPAESTVLEGGCRGFAVYCISLRDISRSILRVARENTRFKAKVPIPHKMLFIVQ